MNIIPAARRDQFRILLRIRKIFCGQRDQLIIRYVEELYPRCTHGCLISLISYLGSLSVGNILLFLGAK